MRSVIAILFLLLLACTAPPTAEGTLAEPLTAAQQNILRCETNPILLTLSPAQREQFRRGCHLFFEETFAGNQRTCGSCHLQNLVNENPDDNNFDLSIEDVEVAFAADSHGPLFRPLDADDGASDFTTLLTFADVRIPFTLPSNVTVEERDSLISADGRTVVVLRSTPTVENIALEPVIMWDGRETDLAHQAGSAVTTHFNPGRSPTAAERADLAFFQRQQFATIPVRVYAAGGPPPVPPAVPSWLTGAQWDSARRGRAFFVDDGQAAVDATHRDLCATCHGGPLLNTTSNSNPVQPAGERFSNNFVSETNPLRPPSLQLPSHTYHFTLQQPLLMPAGTIFPIPPGTPLFPAGTEFTMRSPDPGRLLTTGNPCEFPLSCVIQTQAQGHPAMTSVFKIPTLWGAADSAPYFHDNSAGNIEEALLVYRFLFDVTADGLTALGLNGEPFRLSAQDTLDIINYFNFAFRHQPVLLP